MKTQEFTSKSTSINANRLPVVFSTITNKAAALNIDLENTMVLDSGCGAFPGIISKHFEDRGAGYAGRDPYNQPESVNAGQQTRRCELDRIVFLQAQTCLMLSVLQSFALHISNQSPK